MQQLWDLQKEAHSVNSCKFLCTRGSLDIYRWMLGSLMGIGREFCPQEKHRKWLQGCPRAAVVLWGRESWAEVSVQGKQLQGQLQYPGKCRAHGAGGQWWCPTALLCTDCSASSSTCRGPDRMGQDGVTSQAAEATNTIARQFFQEAALLKDSAVPLWPVNCFFSFTAS